MDDRRIATPRGPAARPGRPIGKRAPDPAGPAASGVRGHACASGEVTDDRELMFRAGAGDRAAFSELYRKYERMVTDFLASRSASDVPSDDISQEVFIQAWKNARGFRGGSSVKTFLLGIAIRVLWKAWGKMSRARKRPPRVVEAGEACPYGCACCTCGTEAERSACRRELEHRVADGVACLPAGLRRAIELTVYRGLELPAAAEAAGCTVGAFRRRLSRAIRRLRRGLAVR